MRGEAKLAGLSSATQEGQLSLSQDHRMAEFDGLQDDVTTRKQASDKWVAFLTERFVQGNDADFDYNAIDHDDYLDTMESRDAEEAWFDDEAPQWATDVGNDHCRMAESKGSKDSACTIPSGDTGIQDF
jgi:hypothetical protein